MHFEKIGCSYGGGGAYAGDDGDGGCDGRGHAATIGGLKSRLQQHFGQ